MIGLKPSQVDSMCRPVALVSVTFAPMLMASEISTEPPPAAFAVMTRLNAMARASVNDSSLLSLFFLIPLPSFQE